MDFCKKCGNKIEQNQAFCKQCGEKNPVPIIEGDTRVKKNAVPKKAGILIILIAIVIAIGLGGHLYFKNKFKPIKVVNKFEETIKKEDKKRLATFINEGQTEISVEASELNGYIAYLKKENQFSKIIKELEKQSQQINSYKNIHPIKDSYGNNLFRLEKKEKKKWGIYDQYVIKVYPIDIKVSSNYPDTEVLLKGKRVKMLSNENKSILIAKTLPGDFKVEAKYNGTFSTLKTNDTIDFSEANENVIDHELQFEGVYINVYSNYGDAKLFINDKDTGYTIDSVDEIGPLATDGSVKLYAEREFPTGKKKSQTIQISNADSIELEFEETETEKILNPSEALSEFMSTYLNSSTSAINYGEFSYVSDYLDPDGPAYKESKDYGKYLYEKGITEECLNVKVTDYKILDENTIEVFTYEEFNIYSPKKDENEFRAFKSDYKVKVDENGQFTVNKLVKTEEV